MTPEVDDEARAQLAAELAARIRALAERAADYGPSMMSYYLAMAAAEAEDRARSLLE